MLRVFCKTGSARLAAAVSLLTLASLTSFAWHSTFYVNTDWPPPCHVQSNQTYYFSTSAGRDSGDPSGAIIEQFIESSTNGAGWEEHGRVSSDGAIRQWNVVNECVACAVDWRGGAKYNVYYRYSFGQVYSDPEGSYVTP